VVAFIHDDAERSDFVNKFESSKELARVCCRENVIHIGLLNNSHVAADSAAADCKQISRDAFSVCLSKRINKDHIKCERKSSGLHMHERVCSAAAQTICERLIHYPA
jgi:hypothetical protein